jgi:hypothetical protein
MARGRRGRIRSVEATTGGSSTTGNLAIRAPGSTLGVDTDLDLLASVALRLLRDPASWVRRRVETISYVADLTIHRQMSVDFVLPAADSADPDDPMGDIALQTQIWVPLWMPRKEPLTHFDVWDEDGKALSVLNTRENGELAARALRLLVPGEALSDDRREQIVTIAKGTAAAAKSALDAATPWLEEVLPTGTSGRVLFEDLSEGFMLLVPISYQAGAPRVIKWSVDERLKWSGHQPDDETLAIRWATALALREKVQAFPGIPVGLAESFHVEVVAPEDVEIADAMMVARQWSPTGPAESNGVVPSIVSVARQHERAHLYVSVLAPREDTEKARGDDATVIVSLRAKRTSSFLGLCVTTLLIGLMLLGVRVRLHQLDSTNAVALLLVFPALVAAYLARPGEHILAARLLGGIRLLALIGAVVAIVTAAMIASGFVQPRTVVLRPASTQCTGTAINGTRRRPPSTTFACSSVPETRKTSGASDFVLGILDVFIAVALFNAALLGLGYRSAAIRDRSVALRRDKTAEPFLAGGE